MSENITPPRNVGQESESEFLKQEAQQARQAIDRSLEELKTSLRTAADLRLWAQHHPWLTVGAAGAAGLAAGAAISSLVKGSPPPQTASDRPPVAENGHAAPGQSDPPKPQLSAFWLAIMDPLFDLAKFGIQTAIASAMSGAMQSQTPEQTHPPAAEEIVEPPTESA